MTANRITLVTLGVADLDRARAYYEALGWQPAEVLEGVVFFEMDGARMGLFGREALAQEQGRAAGELGTGAMTLAQNFSTEVEVDAQFDRALKAGAKPLARPAATAWGGYSGYICDPDGHVWEFAMNPFWPMDESGRLL